LGPGGAREKAAEVQGKGPDPQAQYLQAAAEQAVADAAKKRADTIETIASADLKRAQTAKTIADTSGAHQAQFIDAAEAFRRAAQPPESGM
jgi:broad specificity phosphatase PhoE